ncbi:MAG: NF038122 family metalloprotease [Pirellulales bacterium]
MANWHRPPSVTEAGTSRKERRNARKKRQLGQVLRHAQIEQFEPRQMMAVSPQLISIIPSAGELLNLNGTEVRNQAFREFTIRFDQGQRIDELSAQNGGIQIIRAGGDGNFGNGNEVNVTPNTMAKVGFIGIGDRPNEIVVRFAEHLPDDLYQIRIVGAGGVPLQNEDLLPFNNGLDRTINFEFDLGPQIIAVVPQPIRRSGGQLVQARNEIEVYFNKDDLNQAAATNPAFYQLIRTRRTANNLDDGAAILPTNVVYDPASDVVRLIFSSDLGTLDSAESVYRLRIGNRYSPPLAPNVRATGEAGDTFASANANSNQQIPVAELSSRPVILQGEIEQVTPYDLELPGSNDEPGHRDIPARDFPLTEIRRGVDSPHVEETDINDGIETIYYSFRTLYGTDPQGNALTNLMSPTQKQRAREAFEYYARYLGVQFVELNEAVAAAPQGSELFVVALGDLRAVDPETNTGPGDALVLASRERNLTVVDNAENWGASEPGGAYFRTVMQGIGQLLGMGHAFDLPATTIMGDTLLSTPDAAFPGDHDIVHGRHTHRPESTDIDVFRFTLNQAGVFSAEVAAERLVHSSLLDSVVWVYSSTGELIARNDDYYSEDSYVELELQPGDYYVAVTSTGMTAIDPSIPQSGFGGTTEGDYELRLNFRPSAERTPTAASGLVDIDGQPTLLDGDTDGAQGGEYNFWFAAASAANTLIVDKSAPLGGTGSLASPLNNIAAAFAAATTRNGDADLGNDVRVVRIVGNGGTDGNVVTLADNLAYEIGFNSLGQPLADGSEMQVPKGVTVMVDAGAIFKLRRANIDVGSRSQGVDRSQGHLQVLGTPTQSVFFTSYHNETLGRDTFALPTTPAAGDWGGIVFRNELDFDARRTVLENEGIFINYVNHANFGFGGGDVTIAGIQGSFSPIHLNEARPAVSFNTITSSAGAAIAADPNSFRDNLINDVGRTSATPDQQIRFRADYSRIGPEIYFNRLADNTINGLFIAVATQAGQVLDRLEVPARFNDTDIVHVLAEHLIIQGTPGGAVMRPGVLGQDQPTFAQGTVGIAAGVVTLTGGAWPAWVRDGALLTVGTVTYTVASRDGNTQLTLNNPTAAIAGTANFILVGRPSLQDARLRIDPGIIVKLDSARIETEIGAQLIAEGLQNNRVVFTSLLDDEFGASGTFDTAGRDLGPFSQGTVSALNGVVTLIGGVWPSWAAGATLTVNGIDYTVASRDSDTQVTLTRLNVNFGASPFVLTKFVVPEVGDWGGLYFGPVSTGSVDHALITYAGGVTPVEGGFGGFNAVEIQQADVRLTNSVLENNDNGTRAGRNNQRFFNDETTIYVRGSQPVIVGNTIRNNEGAAISTSANALNSDRVHDWGRSTGALGLTGNFPGNFGPLVRDNLIGGNGVNGMVVRGATLTTQSVWDDTDIVHLVDGEVIVPNHHTFSGLRLQSSATESLVVKVLGNASGITASGEPLDIDDRIGGSVQVVGTPGHPVVITSANDSTAGAGLDPEGRPQNETVRGRSAPSTEASQLNIEYRMSPQLATNTALVAALNLAASIWEAVLDDPITVVFDVTLGTLNGPVGQAIAVSETRSYDEIRQLMIADADRDNEAIVSELPTFEQLQTLLPNQTFAVSPSMLVTRANLAALGVPAGQLITQPSLFDPLTPIDGTLEFEQTATFDFDPSDGITPGAIDFFAVTAHEIGHALGFISAVDDVDAGVTNVQLNTLDLFRLEPGAGATDFTNSPRALDPALPRHVFYDGGLYSDPIVTVPPLTVGDIPMSRGQSTDMDTASHWRDESQLGAGAREIGIMDPVITVGVRNRITDADTRAFDLIGYNAVSRGRQGDWRSVRLDQYSNDRNAAVVTERERIAGANDSALTAQPLGELAPSERSGDENRRLAFEVHGAVETKGDVDVYSFVGRAGAEVWLDIDRTSPALDSVIELVDAAGNVLARSNDSVLRDQTSPGGQVQVYPLQRDVFEGRDVYGTNRHDAGMRLLLPGPAGTQQTYYVRVRSDAAQSRGGYQLQVRLRELDEIPGSTVQYADIRFAINGIEVLGTPGHSPLLGESAETTADNNTRAAAQPLGNVLSVDRGAISVAGSLTDFNDVDWYEIQVDWQKIDDYPDFTGIRHDDFASVIFDVDFAAGAGRPDTTLALYNSAGTLLYISRNSGIADDRTGADVGDLSRGSFGPNDPFLGPVNLRENAGATYYLAVMSDAVLPDALRNNPLARVEPLLAQDRLVDDRVGGASWFPLYANELRDTPGLFFDPIQTFGDAWHLGDVKLFVHDRARLYGVDPYTGALEADYEQRRGPANAGYGDLAMRSDGRLIGMALGGNEAERGSTIELGIGQNTQTTVGDDAIQDGPVYHAMTVVDAGNNRRIIYAVAAPTPDLPQMFYGFNADSGTTDDNLTGFDNDPGKRLGTLVPNLPVGQIMYEEFTERVTGLALVQGEFYGVTDMGTLIKIDPNAPDEEPPADPPPDPAEEWAQVTIIATLTKPDLFDPMAMLPIPFSGLSLGPENVEAAFPGALGPYAEMLFATDDDGDIHAFDVDGVLQNVFAGGLPSVSTGLFGLTGLAFSSLDYNLWHITDRRGQDDGRGIYPTPDGVRGDVRVLGGAGWHFGLERDKGQLEWPNYDTNTPLFNTYDLPGGSHGKLTTNTFSLAGQTFNDNPTLYFNYFSQHDSDATDDPNNSALDSFLVYVSADGANWIPVAKTPVPERFVAVETRTNMQNDTGIWRQARVDLSDFAGLDNVRVRFDFNTGGRNVGIPQLGGEVLGIKDGASILDGDFFVLNHVTAGLTTFEFDTGFNLVAPADGGRAIAEGETFTIDDGNGPVTFEFDKAGDGVAMGNIEILITAADNAEEIAQLIEVAIAGNVPAAIVPHLSGVAVTLEGVTSFDQASPTGTPGLQLNGTPGTIDMDAVAVPIHVAMTAEEVAEAIATTMDEYFIVTVANGVDNPDIFSTTKIDRDALYVMAPLTSVGFPTFSVFDPGPLAYSGSLLLGDFAAGLTNRFSAINNTFEGVILDDFILGSGERGEILSNVAGGNDAIPPAIRKPPGQVLEGAYQVEIRRGIDYGFPLFDVDPDDGRILFGQQLTRGWDSHDHFADSAVITMPAPGAIGPGSTLTFNDGINTVVFEFDLTGSGAVAPGHIPINISGAVTAIDVARITGQAINVHPTLTAVATTFFGVNPLGQPFGSPIIELAGVTNVTSTLTPINIDGIVGTTIDLTVLDPSLIPEGTTIAINDGQRRILFEFDRNFLSDLPTRGPFPITELVNIAFATTAEDVAAALAAAINLFNIRNVPGGLPPGTLLLPIVTAVTAEHTPGTSQLKLRNAVDFAVTVPGGFSTAIVNAKFGDTNPVRDQGQILIHSNTVRDSEGFGIVYNAAPRDAGGSLPHPGAVRNLNEFNTARLVRGVSIANNTIDRNITGGILISGDPGTDPQAPIPVARVYNNTIYGGPVPSGVGIRVNENSSPTLLNNVVANSSTGIQVDASSASTVLGGTVFHRNGTNTVGIGAGTFPILTGSGEELFVDPEDRNFYPIAGSRLIDSSIDTLQERPELANVMTAIGYATSPLLAPERDQLGQLRVNDPAVPSPPGQGSNVFKDRGAVERADFSGPTASLLDPVTGNLLDASITTLPVLQTAPVLEFAVQLIDGVEPADPQFGSGIDDTTVINDRALVDGIEMPISRVTLLRDGVTLIEGLDYIYNYDATNNVIHLQAAQGVWAPNHVYRIRLNNSPLIGTRADETPVTGIRDLAGNLLKANNLQGTTEFVITIDPVDFGDAPAQYPTLFADGGAHHRIVAGVRLGATVTAETNGQPSQNALTDAGDDGVQLPTNFVGGETRQITVTASTAGRLDAWIDFNRDGDWNDAGEQIFANRALVSGANTLSLTAPANAAFGESYARFRFSTTGGLSPTGPANDGEVEDYRVEIQSIASYTLDLKYANNETLRRDLLNRFFVSPGLGIIAEVYVDDNRTIGAAGVRQAFADLVYDNDLIDFDPATLEFGPTFTSGRAGTVDEPNQIVDEAGGVAPSAPGNANRQLLFRVRGTVKATALPEQILTLSLNPADASPAHDTLLFNSAQPVQASYESEPIVIKANPWQNAANPLDVNANSSVTTLDALIIINRLNLVGPAVLPPPGQPIDPGGPPAFPNPLGFYDVNGDSIVNVLDALTVINFLNARQSGAITAAGDTGMAQASSIVTRIVAPASTEASAPLGSSFDVTPLAISIAGSGSTAVAPALAAAEKSQLAAAAAVESAVADLFAIDDDLEPTVKTPAVAPSPVEALDELLAADERWYDASLFGDHATVSLAHHSVPELDWMLEGLELDALGKKKAAYL